jgi:hypothetical protein
LLAVDDGYDAARKIWNGMIDRRPALIARCAGPADVMRCVDFARAHGLLVAVRGSGHNIAGNAACDSGLVIDLSGTKAVCVELARRTARADAAVLGVPLGFGLAYFFTDQIEAIMTDVHRAERWLALAVLLAFAAMLVVGCVAMGSSRRDGASGRGAARGTFAAALNARMATTHWIEGRAK